MNNAEERERFDELRGALLDGDQAEVARLLEAWPEDGQEHAYEFATSKGWLPQDPSKWSRFHWSPTREAERCS